MDGGYLQFRIVNIPGRYISTSAGTCIYVRLQYLLASPFDIFCCRQPRGIPPANMTSHAAHARTLRKHRARPWRREPRARTLAETKMSHRPHSRRPHSHSCHRSEMLVFSCSRCIIGQLTCVFARQAPTQKMGSGDERPGSSGTAQGPTEGGGNEGVDDGGISESGHEYDDDEDDNRDEPPSPPTPPISGASAANDGCRCCCKPWPAAGAAASMCPPQPAPPVLARGPAIAAPWGGELMHSTLET